MKYQKMHDATESIAAMAVITTTTGPTGDGSTLPHRRLRNGTAGAIAAVFAGAFLITLPTLSAAQGNEIVEDCILEGTVDMRKAEQLDQPVYVRFSDARNGSEATCSLNRRSKSRRVRFITTPDMHDIESVSHGAHVRYRYIERDGQPGTWELIGVREER